MTGQALMQEVDKQSWDPSVKALTAFPSVLDNMAKNLAWTSELGEVYNHQPSDVMQAVQALRVKAKDAGNLKTTSQVTVVQQSPSTIVIQPANPQVIYVPEYNPAVVFGTPYVVPGYTAGEVAAASAISFGAGIAIGALMSGGCCHTWGWNTWTVDWHGGYVGYAGHPYYGSSAGMVPMALMAITVTELTAALPITGPTDRPGHTTVTVPTVATIQAGLTRTPMVEQALTPVMPLTEQFIPGAADTTMSTRTSLSLRGQQHGRRVAQRITARRTPANTMPGEPLQAASTMEALQATGGMMTAHLRERPVIEAGEVCMPVVSVVSTVVVSGAEIAGS